MRAVIGAFFAVFFPLLSWAAPSEGPGGTDSIVLTHVTVIDATGRAAQPDQTVVIEGDRIVAVGPFARTKQPKAARVVDARGKFLIPGLWDMHVHIAGVSADPAWSKKVLLPLLLANGITGARDMGGDLEALLSWKQEIEAGTLLGPRIVAAGPWLAARGKKLPEQFPVANEEEARAAVRELKQRGADFIKILTLPSKEVFYAVVDETKKQGLTVAGHVPETMTAAEVSDAGMHSIEHITYSSLTFDCSSREDELRKARAEAHQKRDQEAAGRIVNEANGSFSPDKAAALWKKFIASGTWVVPTINALPTPKKITPELQAKDSRLDYLPGKLRQEWDPTKPGNQPSAPEAAWWTRQFVNDFKLLHEMHRAGVPILAGSDSLDRFVFVGPSLHEEMEYFQAAGFKPMEALQSATRDAARFLGREAEFGTVEAGKRADLILLDANPLVDIANTRKIFAVIRAGKYLNRTALDALLAQAKTAAAAVK